jgi:beta-glucosidase
LKVSVRVTNTGSVPGKEVVQVYISPPGNVSDWRPSRELKEFTKVDLLAGEAKEVSIDLDIDTFSSHWSDSLRAWTLDKGEYTVEVGSQRATFVI